ncbi:hypothetical protein [Plantactinospora sp. CA-290183]
MGRLGAAGEAHNESQDGTIFLAEKPGYTVEPLVELPPKQW